MADDEIPPLLTQEDETAEEVEVDIDADDDQAVKALKQRCEKAGLELREREFEDGQIFRSVLFPSGREKRVVPASGERAKSLSEIDFEK